MTDDVAERLLDLVEASRVPIDAACRPLLERFVRDGAARCEQERVDEATTNLRLLLDDLTQQVRILRLDAIHVPTFASAVARRCPLWPYC